jgi:hypothetical protein
MWVVIGRPGVDIMILGGDHIDPDQYRQLKMVKWHRLNKIGIGIVSWTEKESDALKFKSKEEAEKLANKFPAIYKTKVEMLS